MRGEEMKARLFILFLTAILLSGCATTAKKHNVQVQQLQDRINYLESELEKKNMEGATTEKDMSILYDYDRDTYKQVSAKKDAVKDKLSIKEVQTALKNSGFYKGPIDGKLGSKTKEAIKEFQKANGLKADGVVGKRTANKLSVYLK